MVDEKSFTDEHLQQLGNVLEKRNELKKVYLNFEECKNIGNKGLKLFIKSICKNPKVLIEFLYIQKMYIYRIVFIFQLIYKAFNFNYSELLKPD